MSDDKNNRGGQDRSRINLSEDYEVRYWTERFAVNEEQLRAAVEAVGSSSEKVAAKLGKPMRK